MSRTFLKPVVAVVLAALVSGASLLVVTHPEQPEHVSAMACCRLLR